MKREDLQNWLRTDEWRCEGFSGELLFDEPLARHTYYRIGGPAAVLAYPKSLEDLASLRSAILTASIPYAVIGAGSNLLVADEGFPGLVIRTNRLNSEIGVPKERSPLPCLDTRIQPIRVRTGAGVSISSLLRTAMQEGWGGTEFLCGIPGVIGGAVAMNAGTLLGEVKDRILRVETFDLENREGSDPQIFEDPALKFDYRRNLFLNKSSVIWAAEWNFQRVPPAALRETLESTLARRKETQPLNFPSCGSVFKNPPQMKAWEVINRLGLRGHRIGDAQFSVKHSNFIVNVGAARAKDVLELVELAQRRALEELGIELELEVKIVAPGERSLSPTVALRNVGAPLK